MGRIIVMIGVMICVFFEMRYAWGELQQNFEEQRISVVQAEEAAPVKKYKVLGIDNLHQSHYNGAWATLIDEDGKIEKLYLPSYVVTEADVKNVYDGFLYIEKGKWIFKAK